MNIRNKLFAGFGLVLAFLLLVGGITYFLFSNEKHK